MRTVTWVLPVASVDSRLMSILKMQFLDPHLSGLCESHTLPTRLLLPTITHPQNLGSDSFLSQGSPRAA